MAVQRKRKPVKARYVNSLDGLRALCALGVIAYHMRLPWCQGGLLGVTVLFVLSGYLVTAGLLREFRTTRGHIKVGAFLQRRFWRLMPTVVVFIAVTGAVCALFNHVLFTKMRTDIVPALFMVINWTKILSNESYFAAAGAPSPLTHFWSLAIEAQFYLVWPPIMYFLMRRNVRPRNVRRGLVLAAVLSAALMALLYVPGADPSRPYYGTDTRAMSMLLGAWLAIAWPFDRMSARRADRLKGGSGAVARVIGPLCIAGIVAMMLFTEGYTAFSYYGGIFLCSVLSVGAIACLVPGGSAQDKLFSWAPLVWVGKRSFAIYLWHYPILELLNPLNATAGIPWWKLLAELALILVVSDLSYRFVEQPLRHGILKAAGSDAPSAGKGGAVSDKGSAKGAGDQPSPLWRYRLLIPSFAIALAGIAVTVYGLVTVEPVTAGGVAADEKRVMQASLKKPLQDGVYDVVLIGDSVSLGANEQLNAEFPHGLIDTKGSRQAPEALEALKGYVDQGVVGDDVVWSIGTNGFLDEELIGDLLNTIGPDRRLWMVNLRTPNAKDADNNALIDETVEKYDNVYLIDWLGASQGHDDWVGEDGIHLTWEGRDAFAALVVDTMGYEVPDETNTVYNVVVLGDAVCLDAADKLAEVFPRGIVDTADGRALQDLVAAYEGYRDDDVVGSAVVVCVGNEDQLSTSVVDDIVAAVGEDKSLWLVNVRTPNPWGTSNNEVLADAAEAHDNVELIDWYAASDGHDDWMTEDGGHLTEAGAAAYADLIGSNVAVEEVQATEDDGLYADGSLEGSWDEAVDLDGATQDGTVAAV